MFEFSHAMRLLMVISSLGSGGAERVMSDMANYWARKGWNVTIATWSGSGIPDFYPLEDAVKRVHLDFGVSANPVFQMYKNYCRVAGLRRLVKQRQPNAVLSFMTSNNVLAILATRRLATRTVVSERIDPSRDQDLNGLWRFGRRRTYGLADLVVAQTRHALLWLEDHARAKRGAVIPNPLRRLPEPPEPRTRETFVLAVGRLNAQKGFDLLLRGFAGTRAAGSQWRLVILGEGGERQRLEGLCDELGLSGRVDMPGRVKDPESWMARAALVVQPSRYEGFPNVVLEAMAMGAPVISSDCRSGPSDIIKDGVNGRLVPVNDVAALTQAMDELINNRAERERMGHTATSVRTEFSMDTIMPRWEDIVVGFSC
jgi:glycosyltransferase involved in cell wall biosynthesis